MAPVKFDFSLFSKMRKFVEGFVWVNREDLSAFWSGMMLTWWNSISLALSG